MPTPRKEWIRPAEAARLLKVARATITYRAGTGRYATKRDDDTGVVLVSRRDVLADKRRTERARRQRSTDAGHTAKPAA